MVPKDVLPARVNQHVAIIRSNGSYFPEYIKYSLINLKSYLLKICGVGGTRNALTKDVIEKLEIEKRSITDQQKIAAVLSALDAKIELNKRINAELEAMAKTLYDYWFVQFDFPCPADVARAQGRPELTGKPYKSSGGRMVWSPELKREIPEGWEEVPLSEIANIKMGQSPSGESYNQEGKGIVFYQGCTDFGLRYPQTRLFTTEPSRYAKKGDILLSVRAPVGTLNIAKEECCIGRGLAALNSKHGYIAYLWGVLNNLKSIFDRRNSDGTTFGSITKNDLFSLKVIKPSSDILNSYRLLCHSSFEKQNIIDDENAHLASLRDFLLPMLMNGQVTVE